MDVHLFIKLMNLHPPMVAVITFHHCYHRLHMTSACGEIVIHGKVLMLFTTGRVEVSTIAILHVMSIVYFPN